MAKHNYWGVRRGRKRGVFDSWVRTQEQVSHYPGAEYRGFSTRAQAVAYVGRHHEDVPYLEVHDGPNVTFAPLTDAVRRALHEAGVDLP